MIKVLLLDIDGVLIQPNGYRAAVKAVLKLIGKWMGLNNIPIDETTLTDLEARGISSEFDMIPLILATLWEKILNQNHTPNLPSDILEASIHIGRLSTDKVIPRLQVPYFTLQPYQNPAESAWLQGVFPSIPKELGESLLLHTRDPYRSTTTCLFQQFVLGTDRFRKIYNLEPIVQTDSFLEKYDRPMVNQRVIEHLQKLFHKKIVYPCVMTARPSLPPMEVMNTEEEIYPPESEIALAMVGLKDIPLIGLGKIHYLTRKYKMRTERLLKPSAGHSLAAIIAALERCELHAVQSALEWQLNNNIDGILKIIPKELELHIIEDTLSGIYSAQATIELLKANGYRVSFFPWGLTGNHSDKQRAFEMRSIPCFPNWESLMDKLMGSLSQ